MNEEFIERTSKAWNVSQNDAIDLLNTNYLKSIRINPLNIRKSTLSNLKKQYKSLNRINWLEDAYFISNEKVSPSTLSEFTNGEIIIQNAASYIPVIALDPSPVDNILDLCAAPGGKSSHIAALTNNKASLVLNDTSRTRFFKMKKLMQLMNVNAEYSLRDGRIISKYLGQDVFDKILLDAPCSGEANINLNDMSSWSISSIKRLNVLQTKLINEAYRLLKPGGILVYSTCTITPEENEVVIDSLLKHNIGAKVVPQTDYKVKFIPGLTEWNGKKLDQQVSKCVRLLPSIQCKPFFIAKITKTIGKDEDDSFERLKQAYS